MEELLATNFPDSLDNLVNPNSSDPLSSPSHSQQHANINDAIEAIQTKVGVDNSSDENSLDYRVSQLEETSGAEVAQELGLTSNNNTIISGIENKTTVDSFSKTDYRTIQYHLQISKNSEYYSSELLILNDGTNINVAESNIISNTNNTLATVTFEENSGIINLCVAPISGSVQARYYRTALKA